MTSPGLANAGVLPAGEFYGGANNSLNGQGSRADFSAAAYWQLQRRGFGNLGLIKQRRGERDLAGGRRHPDPFPGPLRGCAGPGPAANLGRPGPPGRVRAGEAIRSADKNFVGLRETTRPAGELLNLIVRPQEVVASLQALNQAFQDYASAVSTFNRAQFELYRALGRPAQWVTSRRIPVAEFGPPTVAGPAAAGPPPAGR